MPTYCAATSLQLLFTIIDGNWSKAAKLSQQDKQALDFPDLGHFEIFLAYSLPIFSPPDYDKSKRVTNAYSHIIL